MKGKVVFITGASSGIGKACANFFAKAGARLLLCARNLEALKAHAQILEAQHSIETHTFALDVRDREKVEETLGKLPKDWKNIDILINNAGLAAGLDPLFSADVEDWEAMIDTNVKGLLYITKAVLPGMIEKNAGHIINIGSIAGHQVYPKGSVYCASKHAVHAITQGLRMDLSGTKIRVSTVDPGAVETNFSLIRFRGDEHRAKAVYEGMTPLSADDVADAVFYCANCPPHVNISEMIIMPTDQASATMISRQGH